MFSFQGCLPSKAVFHQWLTSIKWSSSTKGHLSSKVVFHQRSSSIFKVIFHQKLSFIRGCLPSKVVFHQGLSSIQLCCRRFVAFIKLIQLNELRAQLSCTTPGNIANFLPIRGSTCKNLKYNLLFIIYNPYFAGDTTGCPRKKFLLGFDLYLKENIKFTISILMDFCPALTKLALDLHVNFCVFVCLFVCVSGLFFKASNCMIYWHLTVVLATYLSD